MRAFNSNLSVFFVSVVGTSSSLNPHNLRCGQGDMLPTVLYGVAYYNEYNACSSDHRRATLAAA